MIEGNKTMWLYGFLVWWKTMFLLLKDRNQKEIEKGFLKRPVTPYILQLDMQIISGR